MSQPAGDTQSPSDDNQELLRRYHAALVAADEGTLRRFASREEVEQYLATHAQR
ncbi:MAG: hypothetical protein ACRD2W_09550 [Acidimicrobiales bacterium]